MNEVIDSLHVIRWLLVCISVQLFGMTLILLFRGRR